MTNSHLAAECIEFCAPFLQMQSEYRQLRRVGDVRGMAVLRPDIERQARDMFPTLWPLIMKQLDS